MKRFTFIAALVLIGVCATLSNPCMAQSQSSQQQAAVQQYNQQCGGTMQANSAQLAQCQQQRAAIVAQQNQSH